MQQQIVAMGAEKEEVLGMLQKVNKELEYYKRMRDEMMAFQSDEVSKAILDSHVYKEKIDKLKDEIFSLKKQNKELERY